MKTFFSCLAVPFLISASALTGAHAQEMAAESESMVTFKCEGTMGTCYTVYNGPEIVTVGGNLVEIIGGGDRRICPDGPQPIKGIFFHSPNDPSTGKGYLGVKGCLDPDPINGLREVTVEPNVKAYNSFKEWKSAQAGIHVD